MLPVMCIRQVVAVALQVRAALQDQVFHVRRQPQVSRRVDSVGALAGVLDHGIAGIVDDVTIVSRATNQHPIGSGSPIEHDCCRSCR